MIPGLAALAAALAAAAALLLVRLDGGLAVVNKIDLQHTAAESPAVARLVASLKEPLVLEATLRLVQLLLLALALAALGAALPAGGGRTGGLAAALAATPVAALLARRVGPEGAALELPRLARLAAPLWPLLAPVARLQRLLLGRTARDRHLVYLTREELASLRELDRFRAEETPDEEVMIGRIFDLKETEVSQIMVPIVDVVALEAEQTVAEAVQTVNRTRFSRLPVFRHRVFNITGILHAFDLLAERDRDRPVAELAHPPLYVPETMTAERLLDALRERQIHMAVVVDEYGGATGIVTAEDVIEELVGEIADEHDAEEAPPLEPLPGGGWRVEARITLDELEERTGLHLESQQYDTLAGFLLERLRHIPEPGERLQLPEATLTIRSASEREILVVDVEPAEA
ncbi:MAG: HlyC/CorC family transporter [Nitrospirae bacterium]|nr:MAG: HlyC/CorC family transporter [Nitrospirota bacterium]